VHGSPNCPYHKVFTRQKNHLHRLQKKINDQSTTVTDKKREGLTKMFDKLKATRSALKASNIKDYNRREAVTTQTVLLLFTTPAF
jgi:gamma-glutamyl phosphate reductase